MVLYSTRRKEVGRVCRRCAVTADTKQIEDELSEMSGCNACLSKETQFIFISNQVTFLNSNSTWNSRTTGLSVTRLCLIPSLNKFIYLFIYLFIYQTDLFRSCINFRNSWQLWSLASIKPAIRSFFFFGGTNLAERGASKKERLISDYLAGAHKGKIVAMTSNPGQNVHLVVLHNHVVVSSSHLANSSSQLVLSSSLSRHLVESSRRVVESSRRVVESSRRVVEPSRRVVESSRRVVDSVVVSSSHLVVSSSHLVVSSSHLVVPLLVYSSTIGEMRRRHYDMIMRHDEMNILSRI